jgi:aryl-alcohol dehydrogenase-like predicted oxidoreductase
MQRRTLGRSGFQVSLVGLGANNFGFLRDDVDVDAVIGAAIEHGVTLIDTAESYGDGRSEAAIGAVLAGRRPQVEIATKWAPSGGPEFKYPDVRWGSRRYMMQAVERSLQHLRTDWIDLYQLHRPDRGTPIEETIRAADDLVRQGKVRYVGLSNLPAWQVVEAQLVARELGVERFVSCQDEYSLLCRGVVEPDLATVMQEYGLGLLPFFPLASGLLTGKYRRDQAAPAGTRFAALTRVADRFGTARNWAIVEKLEEFAAAHGRSLLELAFGWLAAKPFVGSIIAGATRPEQVAANAAAVAKPLAPNEVAELDRITGGAPPSHA